MGFCCSCLYGVGRSIPWISILSFILFLTGYGLAVGGRAVAAEPLEIMGVTDLTAFLQDLEVAFFFAFVFNGLGLFASFLATGKTREVLFQQTDYCCASSSLGRGFSHLIAGTIIIVLGQVLIITALSPYLLPREKWSPDYGAASDAA
eukprot:Skav220005  [mRNA]  locus=scaffold947:112508:114782:+ [translate_table: standard]